MTTWLRFIGPIFAIGRSGWNYYKNFREKNSKIETLFEPEPDLNQPLDPKETTPIHYLREKSQVVPFRGREKELERLTNWAGPTDKASSEKNVSVILVTGGPGRGKSRLAREFCKHLKNWRKGGRWRARFLKKGGRWRARFLKDRKEDPEALSLLMEQSKPLLLVIDNAERRWKQIERIVKAALEANRKKCPVRILLVARTKGAWWEEILKAAFVEDDHNPFDLDRVEAIAPKAGLDSEEGRREEFEHALKAFRKRLGKTDVIKGSSDIPGDLLQEQEIDLLWIHMAALLTAYGNDEDHGTVQTAPRKKEKELLKQLVQLEQKSWNQKIMPKMEEEGHEVRRRLIAWLAVTDELNNEEDVRQRLAPFLEFEEIQDRPPRGHIEKAVRELYPSEDEEKWWGGVSPKPLTTWLTQELTNMIKAQGKIVANLPDGALANLLRHSAWYAQRYENSETLEAAIRAGGKKAFILITNLGPEIGGLIGKVAAKILSTTKDVDTAQEIHKRIFDDDNDDGVPPTISLRELALTATDILSKEEVRDEKRALYANHQSICLSSLGKREEALIAIKKAVSIYRRLVQSHPDKFLSNLAVSLNNLSVFLSDLERRKEALTAIKEAVDIYRGLVKARPDIFRHRLAMGLNNLSNRLFDHGEPEEALSTAEEAQTIYRELAKARSNKFRPQLAMNLNNLGIRLSNFGRYKEATTFTEEGTEIFRELAKIWPDKFRPELAKSLNNLSTRLAHLGRYEEALACVKESVTICRKLVESWPDAFRPLLSASFHNLSCRLSNLGQHKKAFTFIRKAVNIRLELAKSQPNAFCSDLANSLHTLSSCLSNLGRHKKALLTIKNAIDIWRRLVKSQPNAFLSDLADSLHSQAMCLSYLEQHEKAFSTFKNALDIYRKLARLNAFHSELASVLYNMSVCLARLGRHEEELSTIKKATNVWRELVRSQPDVFLPKLAMSLKNLSNCFYDLKRLEDALTAIEESTNIYRKLEKARPGAFRFSLANSLYGKGSILQSGGDISAIEALRESIEILGELFLSDPKEHKDGMKKVIKNYRIICDHFGGEPDAVLLAPIETKLEELKPDTSN